MQGFPTRRVFAVSTVLLFCILFWMINRSIDHSLGNAAWMSGYTLLATCCMMFFLSLRKRLLVLPLGKTSYWMQAHQYLGIFSLFIFALHAKWPLHGWLEGLLASTFLFISVSGLIGWYLNRTTPKKLGAAGPSPILEEIPHLRNRLAQQAYSIAVSAAGTLESSTLAEHYRERLVSFFQRPRSVSYALLPNGVARRKTLNGLSNLDRYLGVHGRLQRDQMSQLVRAKDDLDFQQAMQSRLRWWLMIHVASIWLFLILLITHVVMVHRFSGT